MGRKESRIESAVSNYLEQHGFLVRKYNSPGVCGVPDRIVFGYGECFLMEFKAPEGKLSSSQKREIDRIESHGVKVFVVDSIEYGESIADYARITGERNGYTKDSQRDLTIFPRNRGFYVDSL